jgi:type IV pilus assembly protein PilC
VSGHSRALFFRSLATMLRAGVRIDRCLELLSEQAEDPAMAAVSSQLLTRVLRGDPLSRAMNEHVEVFSKIDRRLVKMGEMSGRLDELLLSLADHEESRLRVAMRVQSALYYPAFIFALSLAALIFLPPFLFKGLFTMIEGFGGKVPWFTRLALLFSRIVGHPLFLVGAFVTIVVAVRRLPRYLSHPRNQLWLTQAAMRVPLVGEALRKVALVRFARAFEIVIACGMPVDQGLLLALMASDNAVLASLAPEVSEGFIAGKSLQQCLKETGFFTRAFLSIAMVGEETGRLGALLAHIADLYETELNYTLEALLTTLEPLMLLVMGVFVGGFLIATMYPMLQVMRNL